MHDSYDLVIIGAGVSGTYIARELSKYDLKILILDKDNDIANETTAANSGIIHAGYDPKPGTAMAKFNAPSNKMFDKVCEELDVPFERCGSLVIGFDDNDQKTIEDLYQRGLKNGVPDLKILNRDEVLEMEPNINPEVKHGLYAPTAGVINSWELAIALAENAIDNGTDLRLETKVEYIKKEEDTYKIITDKGNYTTKYVVNCAGVFADEIHNMVSEPSYSIRPRKGNYYVVDNTVKDLVNHIIFQAPTENGKGVLITPTVDGNFLIGPDSKFLDDKLNNATEADNLEFIKKSGFRACPTIPFDKVIRSFAGLRAASNQSDFIVEEAQDAKGFIDIGGFESPGLSSIPAVAEYVVNIIEKRNNGLNKKDNYNPRRRKVVRFSHLSPEERSSLIKNDPAYANVICRCETVTEAEIVDCIHRNAGARSVKAVKKRVRAGAGRCQGGFCGPKVVEILSRELGKDWTEIPYDGSDSYILTGETKEESGGEK